MKNQTDVWNVTVKAEESLYYWHNEIESEPAGKLNESKPLVVELFCGCGGTSLGFEQAGFEIGLGADIHQPSIATFKKNHPRSATVLGDVKKINPELIKKLIGFKNIDVLIAGVPCQGFSLNNRKRHDNDERNFLYKEFVRMVDELKPNVIVLENVSGMKSTANGNFVNLIEEDLSNAGDMNVKSDMLYATDYGVPQNRSRLVFVGVKGHTFEFEKVKKTHGPDVGKPYVTIKDAIGDLPNLKAGGQSDSYKCNPFSDYQKLMRKNSKGIITNHSAPKHPQSTVKKINDTEPGQPMYPRFKQRIRLSWESQSPTQVSGGIRPQFQFGHPEDARGLTIRERCRIQSFPDDFEIVGGVVQGRVQTGNAVPPLLAKAVAKAIREYL